MKIYILQLDTVTWGYGQWVVIAENEQVAKDMVYEGEDKSTAKYYRLCVTATLPTQRKTRKIVAGGCWAE